MSLLASITETKELTIPGKEGFLTPARFFQIGRRILKCRKKNGKKKAKHFAEVRPRMWEVLLVFTRRSVAQGISTNTLAGFISHSARLCFSVPLVCFLFFFYSPHVDRHVHVKTNAPLGSSLLCASTYVSKREPVSHAVLLRIIVTEYGIIHMPFYCRRINSV